MKILLAAPASTTVEGAFFHLKIDTFACNRGIITAFPQNATSNVFERLVLQFLHFLTLIGQPFGFADVKAGLLDDRFGLVKVGGRLKLGTQLGVLLHFGKQSIEVF
jgi:hypothetical protein